MRPRQPQLAKPHCLFEGDRAILIEKVIDVKFSAFQHKHFQKIWVASDWYSLGAIASLPLDILLSNFLKMYMLKSTKFNMNNFFYQYCSIPFKKTVVWLTEVAEAA